MKATAFIYTRTTCAECSGNGFLKRKRGKLIEHACTECHGRGFIETRARITKAERDLFNAFFGD